MTDADWVTWNQAAEIVGCPVSTVESAVRTGRIVRRGWHGHRPTLNRASVEEYGAHYAIRQAERAQRRQARAHRSAARPDPSGWLSTTEASEVLGQTRGHVKHLVLTNRLPAEFRGGRWWLQEQAVRRYAAVTPVVVSTAEAARMAQCTRAAIEAAVARGEIIQHRRQYRSQPSIDRASAEQFAQQRAAAKEWQLTCPCKSPAARCNLSSHVLGLAVSEP